MEHLHAEEVLEEVNALCVILARSLGAGAEVALAPASSPSRKTGALEFANVVSAGSSVQARLDRAVVNVDLKQRKN